MFVSGLGQDYPAEPSSYSIDWAAMFDKALQTWGKVEEKRAQADIAQAQAQPVPIQYSPVAARPLPAPGLSPFPAGFGIGAGGTWVILGAVGLAALYLWQSR